MSTTPPMPTADAVVMSRFRRLFVRSACLAAGLALPAIPAFAQAPTIANLADTSWTKIAQAPTGTTTQWMHFPRGISFDIDSGGTIVKKALINWQTNKDIVMFPMSHGWTGSTNGGVTWNTPSPTAAPEIDMMGLIRRVTDGVMVAIPYYPNPFTGANPQSSFTFTYHTSTNNGATWTVQTNAGSVSFGAQQLGSFRFHRGIIQNSDGTLYAPAYGQYRIGTSGPPYSFEVARSMLMKSTNGGASWTLQGTIGFLSGSSYNETTVVRCKDGSLLGVFRNASSMRYARSTNEGVNWSASATLPGVPANVGTDPYLWLMPNGILVLSYGDNVTGNMRHCYLAYSADGNGTAWTNVTQTFTSSTSGLGNKSSGYTTVFPTRTNRFLQVSDRALYTYYGTNEHPTPNPFSIWTKQIDVVLNHRNRIDLKTKYASGAITVTTDMTYANATFPEARISGAFDGSTDYWSGAFRSATTGTYTIDLQQTHTLNAIGVCLHYNRAQSATIEHSLNAGGPWTSIKTYTNAVHHTLDYTALTPFTARYIRVNVSGASLLSLNEIALFSTADTYEDYAQNILPQGYTQLNTGFWVSEGVTPLPTGYQSTRALYMDDVDALNKEISKTGFTATATKVFQFRVKPKGYSASPANIQFRLTSGTTIGFRLAIYADGSIKWYNGAVYGNTTGTGSPAGPGTIPSLLSDTWSLIRLEANATTGVALLYVNGVLKGSLGEQGTGVATINGFTFASAGGTAIGDQALFDDVSLN